MKKKKENINPNLDTLTNDLIFKETYANIHNRAALEYLLEEFFNLPKYSLKNKLQVSYETPLIKTRLNDKSVRGDLVVTTPNNEILSLEMYSTFSNISLKKSKTYIMRIYSTQLDIGDKYQDIRKVIQINFIDKTKIKLEHKLVSTTHVIDESDFEINIVRLDLLDKVDYNLSESLIRQLRFIGAKSHEERTRIAKGDKILMELNEWIEKYRNDETLKEVFDERKWIKLEGKEEGIELGIEKRNIEIAKKMLEDKADISSIIKYTGLSKSDIENLQE